MQKNAVISPMVSGDYHGHGQVLNVACIDEGSEHAVYGNQALNGVVFCPFCGRTLPESKKVQVQVSDPFTNPLEFADT